jgi:hypothetical protein
MSKRVIILILANLLTFAVVNFVFYFTAFGLDAASDVNKIPRQARLYLEFAAFGRFQADSTFKLCHHIQKMAHI